MSNSILLALTISLCFKTGLSTFLPSVLSPRTTVLSWVLASGPGECTGVGMGQMYNNREITWYSKYQSTDR